MAEYSKDLEVTGRAMGYRENLEDTGRAMRIWKIRAEPWAQRDLEETSRAMGYSKIYLVDKGPAMGYSEDLEDTGRAMGYGEIWEIPPTGTEARYIWKNDPVSE